MQKIKTLFVCVLLQYTAYENISFAINSSTSYKNSYTINICNFAPYPVITHVATTYFKKKFNFSTNTLSAGQCETIVKTDATYGKPLVHFNAYPVSDDTAVLYFKNKKWFENIWKKVSEDIIYNDNKKGLLFCVSNNNNMKQRPVYEANLCNKNEKLRRYSDPIKITQNQAINWAIKDFAICSKLTDINCNKTPIIELSTWANDLYHTVKHLYTMENKNQTLEGVFPTLPGFEVYDHNGPFDLGIKVKNALKKTPFGTPILLQKGDQILYFNGMPVFGRDIIWLIYDTGKRHGYKHVNEIVFLRNGEIYKTTIGLFFDARIYGNVFLNKMKTCASPLTASILSAIDELTFYNQATLTCLSNSIKNEIQFYPDHNTCKFQRDQVLAAFKQFCPKAYYSGEMLGSVTYIGRTFLEKILIKKIPALGGKKLHSKIIRAALLEGAEESIRTLFTSPPGSSTHAILQQMMERGKLQGAIGVGFKISPLLTTGALAPMIYESYNNL